MREHQIIITLKPEQFLQVQRLARTAGAKSMGMFVRQKLLAVLGIEGELEQEGHTADLQPTVAELKRLHAELRGFVAESLAMYLSEDHVGQPVANDPDLFFSAHNPFSTNEEEINSPDASDPIAEDSSYDMQEELAEEQATDAEDVTHLPAEDDPIDDGDPADQTNDDLAAPVQPVAEKEEKEPSAPVQPDDYLEKLADRTFAISPRLGAIEPPPVKPEPQPSVPPRPLRDPLSELLEGSEMLAEEETEMVAMEEEEEAFAIPLSIQERRRQIALQQQSDTPPPDTVESIEETQAQPHVVQQLDSTVLKEQPAREVKAPAPAAIPPKPAPNAGTLGNQSGGPLSGGPPPKRRKS
jgi:hypothetical protein